MHLWSQATVNIHHAALSSLLRPLRLPPGVSIPSLPGVSPVHLDLSCLRRVASTDLFNGPGVDGHDDDDDYCFVGPPCGACEGA